MKKMMELLKQKIIFYFYQSQNLLIFHFILKNKSKLHVIKD
jgi:hypothetical protein